MSAITGCAYYPEHWSEEYWQEDAALMREAGIQVVRLAEFAWDKLEPQPDVYDFEWLDKAIDILAAQGLDIVMCTPTPTPPPWLTHQYPEICRVREDGVRISPGARRHACANVPAYLKHSQKIVEAVTRHYGDHPAVIGWQIDNEFGCGESTRCYCDHCRRRFHEWLTTRYECLNALNDTWGTQFWGATYYDWSHIPIPGITTEPQSPSMRLDYRRFSSDSWVRFQKMQADIIRQNSPGRWITHNFMIRHWSLDYWQLAQDLDFVSYDNYPHGVRNPAEVAMNLDLMWSFKRRAFWIMEQQPGPVNWHSYNPPVPDGQVRLWSHQAIAHGADAIVYFRFRAARTGQEQFHRGLLKWNRDKDKAFYEVQQVANEFDTVPNLTRPQSTVGIVFDYESLWSIEMEPHHQDFSYWQHVLEIYQAYWNHNISVDFLSRDADLSGYDTVIVPAAAIINEREASQWRGWVESGGRLIVTCRSFSRETSNISPEHHLPVGLTDLIGAYVADFMTVPPSDFTDWHNHHPGKTIRPPTGTYAALNYKIWAEILEPSSATSLYTYSDGLLANKTAITHNQYGQGEVIYIGCWVENFEELAQSQGWISAVHYGMRQATLIGDDGSRWQVVMNHQAYPVDGLNSFDVRYVKVDDE